MANTLVGVYENYNQAQSAMNALLDTGFSRSDVRMSSEGGSESARFSSGTDDGSSTGQGIGGFFRSLFGMDDNYDTSDRRISVYSEAADRGQYIVTVDADSDEESQRALEVMNRFNPIDIDDDDGISDGALSDTSTSYAAGTTGTTGINSTTNTTESRAGGTLEGGTTIPIIEEEMRVGKRAVQRGGVRVYQRVTEKPVQESVNLREEHVHVERHAVNQPATAADLNAFQDKSFELRETSEEAVVSKDARVVEEVVVNKEVTQRTENITDTVRRTDVEIEQLGTTGTRDTTGTFGTTGSTTGIGGTTGSMGMSNNMSETGTTGSSTGTYTSSGPSVATTTGVSGTSAAATYAMDDDEADYRRHYESTYSSVGSSGGAYDDYAPAYRYGSTMAGSDQYRGKRWDDVEPHLRSDWESRNSGGKSGSTWENMKESVRHGWNRMTK